MSKEKWAAIVYGRSYHLDFRFIATPEDFGESEINWAFPHVLATTQKPKKLADNPRWSLFKNHSHCVVGVTCMVRDLLGKKEADLTKDNKDRPLYIFVGYVTKLKSRKYLIDLPPYNHESLQDFVNLYDYVRQVWTVKDFYKDSLHSIKTKYKTREFAPKCLQNNLSQDLITKINYQDKNPEQVFLWQNTPKINSQLWATAAICSQPTSVCLGDSYIEQYANNPFLNQTINSQEVFTVKTRLTSSQRQEIEKKTDPETVSLTEIITNKVKQDIQITYTSALQLQQMMLNNFQGTIEEDSPQSDRNLAIVEDGIYQDFGFKTKATSYKNKNKISESPFVQSDWF